MAKSSPDFRQPHWWTDAHDTAWDHVRETFRSKWEARRAEQADVSAGAEDWDEIEPAVRFGFGRRRAEPDRESSAPSDEPSTDRSDWDPELEATLEQEWDSMHHPAEDNAAPRLWHDVRQFVHRGWFGP